MSWIIESLLNKKELIRETCDIESDEFNDLLIVEKAIKDLQKQGLITQEDLDIILDKTTEGKTRNEKYTLSKKRSSICNRIAYYLGGYFTDDGYLSYIKKKYKLSREQVISLQTYMKSEYRNKVMRRPLNDQ